MQTMVNLDISVPTGAFDAVLFQDRGDAFVGFYANQRGMRLLFSYAKLLAEGSEEVDNTVYLAPEMMEKLAAEQPELLEKMRHSRPHVLVDGALERCRFSDGIAGSWVFDVDGQRLPSEESMDPALFAELKAMAEGFIGEWLWFHDSPDAEKEGAQAEFLGWPQHDANIRPELRDRLRTVEGSALGEVTRYAFGIDTEQLSTDNVDEYNTLNFLVELRDTAQKIYERWY